MTEIQGLTVIEGCTVVSDGDVVVRDIWINDGLIVEPGRQADSVVDGRELLALPAFVNPHVHLGETILRGGVRRPTLARYLAISHGVYERDAWWERRAQIRSACENVALYEVVKSGTGTICTSRSWAAVRTAGIRGLCGYPLCRTKKLNSYYDGFPAEFVNRVAGESPDDPVRTVLYVQSMLSVDIEELEVFAELQRQGNVRTPLFIHVHESEDEPGILRRRYGRSAVRILDDLGLLCPASMLIHCVWVDEQDLDLIEHRDAPVVFCPVANARLRVGLPPIREASARNIRWSLGTDGLAANDSAHPLETAKFAALVSGLHRPPQFWIERTTSTAADVLGLGHRLGRLLPGYCADIALYERTPGLSPISRVVSNVLYNWPALELRTLIVAGRVVLDDREPLFVNRQAADELNAEHRLVFGR